MIWPHDRYLCFLFSSLDGSSIKYWFMVAYLFIEIRNYKSALTRAVYITNNDKSRAKFSDELYLRRHLKLFRSVSRLFTVATATAIDPDSHGDSSGTLANELKFIVHFASRCHKSESDLLLSCRTVWRIAPITFKYSSNGDVRFSFWTLLIDISRLTISNGTK